MDAAPNSAQVDWAALAISDRLLILKRARHCLAERSADLVDAIPATLPRTKADSLASEVLPLLEACRFLELSAKRILAPRRLGRRGLPFWLSGVESSVERIPLGTVLVIGPSNYPLFLPGVQVLQALAAGNAAVWKPGTGGGVVAACVANALSHAGLPEGVLRVTSEAAQDAADEMQRGVDKVFFTGSGASGQAVLRAAAETATPVVVELSGCDAVVALPSADPVRLASALEFGMRLNGSATCMAPRRLMLVGDGHEALIAMLRDRFSAMEGVLIREPIRAQLKELVEDAAAAGATICGDVRAIFMRPLLVLDGRPEMRLAQADVFAPVLTVMHFANVETMLRADAICPFGLTAAVFGEEKQARAVTRQIKAGTVLVNDLMVPTVDPRVPYGGRRRSGFGVTRGAEGLLEMTAVKTVLVRHGKDIRHYEATGPAHEALFRSIVRMVHGRGLLERMGGLRGMIKAAKKLKQEKA